MEFDKKTIAAFILIGAILIFIQTDFYQEHLVPKNPNNQERQDIPPLTPDQPSSQTALAQTHEPELTTGDTSAPLLGFRGEGETVTVQSDLYRAEFSTQGATLRSWTLNGYFLTDGAPVQLVGEDGFGNLATLLPTRGDTIDTSPLVFKVNKKQIVLSERHPSDSLEFVFDFQAGQQLKKTMVFTYGRHDFVLKLHLGKLSGVIDGYSYGLTWRSGLRSTEPDFDQDMSKSFAYAYQGDAEEYDAGKEFDPKEWDHPTDWVAIRTKYFAVSVIPKTSKAQGVEFYADKENVGKKVPWKKYAFELEMPLGSHPGNSDEFTVFLGPLSYHLLKSYNAKLEDMMDLGGSIFRPFGKFILWCFVGLHKVIPNYGFVIIVFSILIKLVLYPLTKKSYQSMKEMQSVQPLMQEINEKYKNDPQKKQQEIMSLYKEHGINPLGGCLPMILQLPLLYALFQVFQSTIQLRQADFIWWISDLSRPDTIAHLPFTIPIYGDSVNILPLFMGVTMFIQQKMSMKDPKQKALVYIMPVFFTLLFNSFPSGLNLYYALFNVLSIAQEKLIPYHPKKPEELKQAKAPKKRVKHDYRGRYYK
jgi:YidC/Oxa1 family membrane protein insertase